MTITREVVEKMARTSLDYSESTSKKTNKFQKKAFLFSTASPIPCRITTSDNYELKVEMWDSDGNYAVARYDSLQVTSEQDGFRLLGSIHTVMMSPSFGPPSLVLKFISSLPPRKLCGLGGLRSLLFLMKRSKGTSLLWISPWTPGIR